MRKRIIWIFTVLLTIGIGAVCLNFYFRTDLLFAQVLLYTVATLAITIGTKVLVDIFESLIRGMEETKTPFAVSIFWLSPTLFTLYQLYSVDGFVVKLILGILVLLFSFIFVATLAAAISDTALGRRKLGISASIIVLSLFIIVVAILLQSIDILVFFLPLIIIVAYSSYILTSFLQTSQSDSASGGEQTKDRKSAFPRLELALTHLNKYVKQSFMKTLILIFILCVLSILCIKGIFPLPKTVANLYQVRLTVYAVLLGIIAGFSTLYLRQSHLREHASVLRKPLLGLAQMCIVFIMISLVGMIIGADIDITIFAAGATPGSLLHSGVLLSGILSIVQVIVLQLVILSFPPILMYIYGIIKTLHETP